MYFLSFIPIPNVHFQSSAIYFSLFAVDLVQSATLFRKAAGVYQHLAEFILPFLRPKPAIKQPPEYVAGVASVMSLLCLAEAQVSVHSVRVDALRFMCLCC